MKKIMNIIAVLTVVLTIIFTILYNVLVQDFFLTLAITCGTTAYHFCIRLLIGAIYNLFMKNRADYNLKWFQVGLSEQKFYEKIRVKEWKKKMPTYDGDVFDVKKHTWDEIAQATCQSELVHETIIVFSFLPVLAYIWFGALPVFIITSLLSALFDMMFVFMQRYNRPRIIKLIKR